MTNTNRRVYTLYIMFNNLHYIEPSIRKELAKNHNRTYSGLFKDNRMRVPLIGDYPILSHIGYIAGTCKKRFNREQVRNACKYSIEWKSLGYADKTKWLDKLMEENERGLKEVTN